MAINFLDNVQFNQNQLLGARIENVTSDPSSANGGDIIFNSTSGKLKYYDGTNPFNASGWISLPDGTGIGGSGTVGRIPVFNSTTEITDSQLITTGSGGTQTFLFNTLSDVTFKGSISFDSASGGIKDVNGQLGNSGQLLSSTGTSIDWINAPVSYTKWVIGAVGGSTADVNDGDKYQIGENSTIPGIFPLPPTKSGTIITQEIGLHAKNMALTTPGNYSTDKLLWSPDTTATSWKVNKTRFTDVTISTWAEAEADINMGGFKITDLGTPSASTDAANKAYVDAAGDTYSLSTSSTTQGIVDIILDAATGTDTSITLEEANSSSVQIARDASGNIEFSLRTDVTVPGDLTVGGGDISLTGTGRIQGVDTVTVATDAANKQYVDNAVVGGFNVKGGFNASTGITAVAGTNLYTNTAVAVGDYYVVTVAGNFFGQASTPLTVGDSVLAQTAAASGNASITDFAVIQSDTDLATLTTVGLGNVNEATTPDLYGIDVQYSSGTASVGLDIDGLSAYDTSSSYPDDDYLVIYASDDGTFMDKNMKVSLTDLKTALSIKGSFSGTSSSATSHVFTHNLGTYNVVVQIFDTSSKETIYASVDRNSTNQVTVTTASSASITCLIQEV